MGERVCTELHLDSTILHIVRMDGLNGGGCAGDDWLKVFDV